VVPIAISRAVLVQPFFLNFLFFRRTQKFGHTADTLSADVIHRDLQAETAYIYNARGKKKSLKKD
jgi:hypothetical protein